jgi:purine-binding chemotaxis protein CheW
LSKASPGWHGHPRDNQPFVIFSLNRLLYGVDAHCVREIFFLPELTPVAQTPPDIAGFLNLRGDILPVMDLNVRFGYASPSYDITDSLIVLEWQDVGLGIIANRVDAVETFDSDALTTNLNCGRDAVTTPAPFLAGIAQLRGEIVMLLNLETLIRYSESIEVETGSPDEDTARGEVEKIPPSASHSPNFCPEATEEERAIFRERANWLCQPLPISDLDDVLPLAVIGLGGEYFGVELKQVREFTEANKVTPIPCCPAYIIGNINIRGEIITLIDIYADLNLPISPRKAVSKVMVVQVDDVIAGVTVDEIVEVIYLNSNQVMAIPAALRASREGSLRGTVPYRGQTIGILDLSQILMNENLILEEYV